MSFTEYKVTNGVCIPVNPFKIEDKGSFTVVKADSTLDYAAFESWLLKQPTIFTNAVPGIYTVSDFGEQVWQYWDEVNWNEVEDLDHLIQLKENNAELRRFLKHIGQNKQESEPTKDVPATDVDPEFIKSLRQQIVPRFPETVAEVEAYEKIIGNPNINFPVEEMSFDHIKKRVDQTATPEQKGVEHGEEITNSGYVFRVKEIEKLYEQHLGNLTSLYVNEVLTEEEYKNLTERIKGNRKIMLADLLDKFKSLNPNHTQQ